MWYTNEWTTTLKEQRHFEGRMDVYVIAVPHELPPRLRRRLGEDLLDHAKAFCAEAEAGTPTDVLDPG